MTPATQLAAIDVKEGRAALQAFGRTLMPNNPNARMFCAIHPEIGNLEFLAALNSDVGLFEPVPGQSEEELARAFLQEHCVLFRLPREELAKQLTLKHTSHSLLGSHLTFELQAKDGNQRKVSLNDACFVVHFDQQRRIVMIAAVYEPEYTFDTRQLTPADVTARVEAVLKPHRPLGDESYSLTQEFLLDTRARKYRIGWQLKFLDRQHVTRYVLIGHQRKVITSYSVNPSQPSYWGFGQVYERHWERHETEPGRHWVVLRDLTRKRDLVGRYVSVIDKVNSLAIPTQRKAAPLTFVPDKDRSGFDRIMAYYHTNLAQHYFRDLGLFELDRYPDLMPLRVVLTDGEKSSFAISNASLGQPWPSRILLNRLGDDETKEWTQAREARVIYHEFTHAVTDALARLHRGNHDDPLYRRYRQTLQAAAMDEALGDYFACSLAARAGVTQPTFGILVLDNDRPDAKSPKWTEKRILITPRANTLVRRPSLPSLRPHVKPDESSESIIYRWSQLWASYLWQLRCDPEIGPANADRLIAHSIFFLTRWATFAGGLLALLLTDALLFEGRHVQRIQDLARERRLDIAKFEIEL